MTQRTATAWPDADLTACGLPAPDADLSGLPTGAVCAAITATKNGHCFLDWQLFQFALSMYARVCAGSTNVVAAQKALLDPEAQTALEMQMSLESTEYAARILIIDALRARDRLPRVYATMRLGLIDRDRFHRIAHETHLVIDEAIMARLDALIAAEILGSQRGYTSISVTKTGALARRLVAEHDPDAARRVREGAKAGRSVGFQAFDSGMAQLFLTATAEDVRLARQMLDGHGPISAEHVREIAARGDAVIHQHRLDDLLEPDPASASGAQKRPDEAAVHRRAPRPESPDECRGDDPRPPAESGADPASVIAKTSLPSDPYRPNLLTYLIARFLGQSVEVLAPNQWLIPRLADLRCTHRVAGQHATGITTGTVSGGPQRARTRTAAKHARRCAERKANRDRRLTEDAGRIPAPVTVGAVPEEDEDRDEPPC